MKNDYNYLLRIANKEAINIVKKEGMKILKNAFKNNKYFKIK